MRRVRGVGINDADYKVQIKEELPSEISGKRKRKVLFICPYYQTWMNMLRRCYSSKEHITYADTTVCGEWLYFSKFKLWMEQQDWERKHLDKDILVVGNKVYSPDTCVFVGQEVNKFILESLAKRGGYPLGVCFDKQKGRFLAQTSDNGKHVFIGYYENPTDAHQAWRSKKLDLALVLAEKQTDVRVKEALISRYKF